MLPKTLRLQDFYRRTNMCIETSVRDYILQSLEDKRFSFSDYTTVPFLKMLLGNDFSVLTKGTSKFLHSRYYNSFYRKEVCCNSAVGDNWLSDLYEHKVRLTNVPNILGNVLKKTQLMPYPEFYTGVKSMVDEEFMKGKQLKNYRKVISDYNKNGGYGLKVKHFLNENIPNKIVQEMCDIYHDWRYKKIMDSGRKMLDDTPWHIVQNLKFLREAIGEVPLDVVVTTIRLSNGTLIAYSISEYIRGSGTVRTVEAKKIFSRHGVPKTDLNKLSLYLECLFWKNHLKDDMKFVKYSLGTGTQVEIPRDFNKFTDFAKTLKYGSHSVESIKANMPFIFENGLNKNKLESGAEHVKFPLFCNF